VAESPDYRIRSLTRGLDVLRCWETAPGELHLSAIAEQTDLPLPTVLRIVRTLAASSFVESTHSGGYRPGIAALRLGFAALDGMDVVRVADAPLRDLAHRTMETINLAVLDGADIRYLLRIRNADLVTADIRVGSRLPASCTSMGKVLLAYLPEVRLAGLLDDLDLQAGRGPNAIHEREALVRELAMIRTRGWSGQDEELAYGLRSIAVPVRDRSGAVVAAVNMPVPATRWSQEELIERFLSELTETAGRISERLGSAAEAVERDGAW
jgi:IclR family transcriptional regulator, pca regulon regulatory protein